MNLGTTRSLARILAVAASLATLPLQAQESVLNKPMLNRDALAIQVALDRAGFSPGVIDASMGMLTRAALRGFQTANGIRATGNLDPATQAALADGQLEPTATVVVTPDDAAGPFLDSLPESMAEKATLDGLFYTSIVEALAEKYHTTPRVLRALNPGSDFAQASRIAVPAVRPADIVSEGSTPWDATLDKLSVAKLQPSAAQVVVDKSDKQVRVFDADGNMIALFPATIGSQRDPLPLGKWRIRGVGRLPDFHYNPRLFWDASARDKKATLPPGPNGPVGVVWIDLSKDHYGIHGTPEPEKIGRTESHGCIRLTNWDAARLAQMVRSGTPALLQR
jgi:lipoprotein-anchoring transpeptidase ErfK/SrfK